MVLCKSKSTKGSEVGGQDPHGWKYNSKLNISWALPEQGQSQAQHPGKHSKNISRLSTWGLWRFLQCVSFCCCFVICEVFFSSAQVSTSTQTFVELSENNAFIKSHFFSCTSLLQVCSMSLTLFSSHIPNRRLLRVWQILLSGPFVLCGFFLSLISFCCKQHLCTSDKFNNHDSI